MGLIIDINERVSVELRRESARLIIDDATPSNDIEFDYCDAEAVGAALHKVIKSDRYLDDFARRQKLGRGSRS